MSVSPKKAERSITSLKKLATPRRTLISESSECTVHINLSEPVSVWDMDRPEIEQAATSHRCDFATLQGKNLNDGKSYLILIECKRRFHRDDINHVREQIEGGLEVLRHLSGGNRNFPFNFLKPVWVAPGYPGAIPDKILQDFQVRYNNGRKNRKVRIRPAASGTSINDNYVTVKGKRR